MASVVILAGANGSGKSTTAPVLLQGTLQVMEFVNADAIARGLSGFDPNRAAFRAGRLMLDRLRELADARVDFAFETTLASKTFAPWLRELIGNGYELHLVFLWLPSPEMAIARVQERVRLGGHHVPDDTVRRRYEAGLSNFFRLYQPLATTWTFRENTGAPRAIASGSGIEENQIVDQSVWESIKSRWKR